MALHKDLTGADLHEPKGVSTATSGQVYEANGAGTGVWTTLVIPTGTFYTTHQVFTASGTWTKPASLFLARVHVQAAGGAASPGAAGNSTSFGAHCSATGGGGGTTTTAAGGAGSGGNVNLSGGSGQGWVNAAYSSDYVFMPGGTPGGPFPTKGIGGQAIGSGASGSGSGGGGGYSRKDIVVGDLGATETVTIGTNGAANGYVLVEEFISI